MASFVFLQGRRGLPKTDLANHGKNDHLVIGAQTPRCKHCLNKLLGGFMDFNVVEENGRTREMYVLKEPAVRKGRAGGKGKDNPCEVKVGLTLEEKPPRIVLRAMDKSGTGSLVAILTEDAALRVAGALQNVVSRLQDGGGEALDAPPYL